MKNLPIVILVDSNTVVKNRIRRILSEQGIVIYEAFSRQELLSIFDENKGKIDLIISEVEINTDRSLDGISLIKLVKSKSETIPVMILTAVSRKEVITQYLLEGASDYILKPFEDTYLKEKIFKHLNFETLTESTVLRFSLKTYLENELYKANKGSSCFTLLKISFKHNEEDNTKQSNLNFVEHSKKIYQEIKLLFWNADLYIQHSIHSHLGFFPFCNHENSQIIIEKITSKFEELKRTDPTIKNYTIKHAYATYPTDGESATELLKILETRSMEDI
ncbi:response regulator [Acetobacterium paludosum]|uniref:response regulator n=1 Tax=Acetobacterium paludosum TaxID=52693 RepID=UPI0014783146|nr:response regulator [Acetobacterium paludosum]